MSSRTDGRFSAAACAPWALVLLAATLSLAFLGLRGVFDPDEGRYINVALNMLDSGDWVHPHRNDDVAHWTKPPLTYWAIAASVTVFGQNAWAARLPSALAYLACVWLTWLIARRLIPESRVAAAVMYATMILPFAASQLITTDFILAATQALALWAFVEARFGPTKTPRHWLALMWAAFALGFMTKGPPALLGLLPVLIFNWLHVSERTPRALQWSGLAVFALVALPWYLAVITDTPGLLRYFLGAEVIGRVTSNSFGRHPEWYGWLLVYAPTLALGTLPWTPALGRWARALPSNFRRWHNPASRAADQEHLFLATWVLVPLLVFCLSRSRLPLYVLPIFLPLALLAARQRQLEGRALPGWRVLTVWAVLLMGIKFAGVYWPTPQNSAAWAGELRARVSGPIREVLFLEDKARYGLRMHLGAEIEHISLERDSHARRINPSFDEDLAEELAEGGAESGAVWICQEEDWPHMQSHIRELGFRAEALGSPYYGRIIFSVAPA